mmetsp:Transcript_32820/g.93138  ORF Transcript_32820/g.93138 Transcript_32820/m.93138 type:complete len:257 (-) Transcript_32820:58-828(-)
MPTTSPSTYCRLFTSAPVRTLTRGDSRTAVLRAFTRTKPTFGPAGLLCVRFTECPPSCVTLLRSTPCDSKKEMASALLPTSWATSSGRLRPPPDSRVSRVYVSFSSPSAGVRALMPLLALALLPPSFPSFSTSTTSTTSESSRTCRVAASPARPPPTTTTLCMGTSASAPEPEAAIGTHTMERNRTFPSGDSILQDVTLPVPVSNRFTDRSGESFPRRSGGRTSPRQCERASEKRVPRQSVPGRCFASSWRCLSGV